jgi:hypothetical protein
LLEEQHKASENHSRIVQNLKQEFESQQKILSQQYAFRSESTSKERDVAFESDTLEYTAAIATASRNLEEKRLELKRVEAENQWLVLDNQNLKEQMEAKKRIFDAEQSNVSSLLVSVY